MGISNTDNTLITTAFQHLFSTLSAWEPNSNLLLDISVHSPSDSEHWFKYITFGPHIPSDECGLSLCTEQSMLVKLDDHQHGWITGSQNSTPSKAGIHKVFDEIIGEGPFDDNKKEDQWWQQLPLVPAATGVLLRQQNRRRWKPTALAQMFARLPRLQEIYYEPWREWCDTQQEWTDQTFMDSFMGCSPIRIPTSDISCAVAKASLKLEYLSASFIVDASYFFYACEPHWKWPSMTLLTLTSQLLTPDESPIEIDNMLRHDGWHSACLLSPAWRVVVYHDWLDNPTTLFDQKPRFDSIPEFLDCPLKALSVNLFHLLRQYMPLQAQNDCPNAVFETTQLLLDGEQYERVPATPLTSPVAIVYIPDTHNTQISVPDGHILIHLGDLTKSGSFKEIEAPLTWLCAEPHPTKIFIAGYHSYYLIQDGMTHQAGQPLSEPSSTGATSST
ncbi:uncharacterized protein N7446_000622 [Penicillium canescens]|nr:uncharacterized protein N7446_000622 [Penicillium canescens]KAJ6077686.1 hypothetical protein N7446_000622 [Penicillium canescens]